MANLTFDGKRLLFPGGGILNYYGQSPYFSSWFLPSQDELTAMYNELYLEGVGDFNATIYWSSTETGASTAFSWHFNFGGPGSNSKNLAHDVRAARIFYGAGTYGLRDIGPGGGLIFHIDGTTYYEAAASNQSNGKVWSNLTTTEIGVSAQGTGYGDGLTNTSAIISQIGHTDSAAKLCNDYSV
jgi:hypothetical protein